MIGGGLIGIQWGALRGIEFVLAVAFVVLIVAMGAALLWQRNEARREFEALREANKPRLSFSLLSPIPTENKRGGEIARIKIENANGPDIQYCQVNLESLTKHDGTEVDQRLPVALCTDIQTGKLRGTSSPFNLPWGQSQQLYFAWNPKKIEYKPRILTEREKIELPEPGKYIAILQAAGSNTQPASYTLELDYKPDGQLDVTEVNTDDGAPYRQERGTGR